MITVSDELKPCPFCAGAMEVAGQMFRHVKEPRAEVCPLAMNGWPVEMAGAWNTRATPITNTEASGDDVVQVAKALIVAEFPDNGGEALANSAQEGDWPMWQKAVAQARAAIATLSPNGVSQSAVDLVRNLATEIMVAVRREKLDCHFDDEQLDEFEALTLTPMLATFLATQPASDTGLREALDD